jgi:methylaspartate mutase epsilon subunit
MSPDPTPPGGLPEDPSQVSFADFVGRRSDVGELVVQPRMGVSTPAAMRAGLVAVRDCAATTVGTLTLDSYTRVRRPDLATQAMAGGHELNGYPLLSHDDATTRAMLAGVASDGFPVQVRHGSAQPYEIVVAMRRAGLAVTEGGPISYCLPYSRVPLRTAVADWARSTELLARTPGSHLESFGGCLMGQLCPPSLLVAVGVLEGIFFRAHGMRSVSLSYAQQSSPDQDREAIRALRDLADEFIGDLARHTVVYTYMGVFPRTAGGAAAILADSVRLAVDSGAERVIVKTAAEAHGIPGVASNVAALEAAGRVARTVREQPREAGASGAAVSRPATGRAVRSETYLEARTLIEAVLELAPTIDDAIVRAFALGVLDVPYCLHPDNAGAARAEIAGDGRLRWVTPGRMPVRVAAGTGGARGRVAADGLLAMLNLVAQRYDRRAAEAGPAPVPAGSAVAS